MSSMQRTNGCNRLWSRLGQSSTADELAAFHVYQWIIPDLDGIIPFKRPHLQRSTSPCQQNYCFQPFLTQKETFLVATFFFFLAKQFFFLPTYSFRRQLAMMTGFCKDEGITTLSPWDEWVPHTPSFWPNLSQCKIVNPTNSPQNCHFKANSPNLQKDICTVSSDSCLPFLKK